MATLICPDVHERIDRLLLIEEKFFPKADRIVMLGDFFDAFGPVDLRRVGQICGWINGHVNDPKMTFLGGNHDFHYFFKHDGFKCSGYNPQKQDVIDANLPDGIREKFRIFTRVGPYLVSHAGFTEATLQYCTPEVEAEAIKTALAGGFDPLFGAGYDRGGDQPVGGPTWLDWSNLQHIDDCPQIVGHTHGGTVRYKGGLMPDADPAWVEYCRKNPAEAPLRSICLDTALRNVAFVDENSGVVTVENIFA